MSTVSSESAQETFPITDEPKIQALRQKGLALPSSCRNCTMKTGGSACLYNPTLSSPVTVKDLRTASIKIRRLVAVTARGLRLWLTVASDVLVTVPAGAAGETDLREGSEEASESSVARSPSVRDDGEPARHRCYGISSAIRSAREKDRSASLPRTTLRRRSSRSSISSSLILFSAGTGPNAGHPLAQMEIRLSAPVREGKVIELQSGNQDQQVDRSSSSPASRARKLFRPHASSEFGRNGPPRWRDSLQLTWPGTP
jgi:hypothetical protein